MDIRCKLCSPPFFRVDEVEKEDSYSQLKRWVPLLSNISHRTNKIIEHGRGAMSTGVENGSF